jgi:hypothetical protein
MPIANYPYTVSAGEKNTRPRVRTRFSERRDNASREQLLERVLAEFREMPCLRLTPAQAQRLFGLRADISSRVIETLIRAGHVRLDPDGRYAAIDVS